MPSSTPAEELEDQRLAEDDRGVALLGAEDRRLGRLLAVEHVAERRARAGPQRRPPSLPRRRRRRRTASSSARQTSGSISASAITAGLAAAVGPGDHGVGACRPAGARRARPRSSDERQRVGLGLALVELHPRDHQRGRAGVARVPASGSASVTLTERIRRALPANQRRRGQEAGQGPLELGPAAPGDQRLDRGRPRDGRHARRSAVARRRLLARPLEGEPVEGVRARASAGRAARRSAGSRVWPNSSTGVEPLKRAQVELDVLGEARQVGHDQDASRRS